MNANSSRLPTSNACTPRSMLSWPRLGPIARSSIAYSGAASEPARSNNASDFASPVFRPVIWKLLENTPRIVATLMTCSSVESTGTLWPSRFTYLRTFLDEDDRHRAIEVRLRGLEHLSGAARVETHRDRGAFLRIDVGLGIGQLIAGDDHVTLEQHRPLVLRVVELGAERCDAAACCLVRIARRVRPAGIRASRSCRGCP